MPCAPLEVLPGVISIEDFGLAASAVAGGLEGRGTAIRPIRSGEYETNQYRALFAGDKTGQ